jgi:hypothetical protein
MAITIWKGQEATPLAQTLAIDPALMTTRAAQEARRRGILLAKQQALRAAEGLLAWGHLLTWAIIFVSAIHIWETVAAIAPASVGALQLPAAVYHGAALAFTLMIDACALYIAKSNAAAAFVGAPTNRWTIYFYLVTALLNASFVASHAPAIDATVQARLLPLLAGSFVLLLPLSIPAGIVAVEASNRTLEATRLALLVEVETLRGLAAGGPRAADVTGRQNPAPPVPADAPPTEAEQPPLAPMVGGRTPQFRVDTLIERFGGRETFSPVEVQRALGCSETSVRRLLAEGLDRGMITKCETGVYTIAAHGRRD